MTNILAEIVKNKRLELEVKKIKKNYFYNAIRNDRDSVALIAEIKCASPSANKLINRKQISQIVREYKKAGVNAISVVTDKKYFNGDVKFISKIKKLTNLPILQKDFVIDEVQIYEAKAYGANALLIIARILNSRTLNFFVKVCFKLGIEPVVEVYDKKDLKKALRTSCRIIGVNARNIDTLKVDIVHAYQLISLIPKDRIAIGFSGVISRAEVEKYSRAGAQGVLVGTSLLIAKNKRRFITALRHPGGDWLAPRSLGEVGMDSSGVARPNVTKVKICGIRDIKSAMSAINAVADFLGFNFVPTSSRFINPLRAKSIIKTIKGKVKIVGVFQNADSDYVNKISDYLQLDYVQLHGEEAVSYCKNIKKPIIKVYTLQVDFKISDLLKDMSRYDFVDYFLLDRIKQTKTPPIYQALHPRGVMAIMAIRFFIAGGLTIDNVAEAISKIHPYGVDVARGIETNGKQDIQKITKFLQVVKSLKTPRG